MSEKKTPAPKTIEKEGFQFDTGLAIPDPDRSGGKQSDTAKRLAVMPVGASFLHPVTVSDHIKDQNERERAMKEEMAKGMSRANGAVRRFKEKHPEHDFAVRRVNDEAQGVGVRIWRTK